MSVRSLITAAFAATALAAPKPNPAKTTTNPTAPTTTILATATNKAFGLNDAAKAAGKRWFGTAADIPGPEQQDVYYMREFNNAHDFGEATPANIMKFQFTEPEQNVFNFTGGDDFINLAKASGKEVRCHNLIWQSELSNFVTNPSVPWTNKTLSAVLKNHVTKVVEHFGDRCYSWDVVNEAFADSPAGAYQSNIWYNTIGAEYVPMAFAAAQAAVEKNGLNVKLYYNDYNIESPGAKTTAALNLVSQLKGRGIQIDGVGLESHFIVGMSTIPPTSTSVLSLTSNQARPQATTPNSKPSVPSSSSASKSSSPSSTFVPISLRLPPPRLSKLSTTTTPSSPALMLRVASVSLFGTLMTRTHGFRGLSPARATVICSTKRTTLLLRRRRMMGVLRH